MYISHRRARVLLELVLLPGVQPALRLERRARRGPRLRLQAECWRRGRRRRGRAEELHLCTGFFGFSFYPHTLRVRF